MNAEIKRVEHKGQAVITTEQLAEIYGTETINLRNNFKRNRMRFVEGKHYFKLTGEALKNLRVSFSYSQKITTLILWTARGANRHSKILDTDQAWEQFERLEETYFREVDKKLFTEEEVKQIRYEDNLRIALLQNKVEHFNIEKAYEHYKQPNKNGHLRTKPFMFFKGEKEQTFKEWSDELGLYREYRGEFKVSGE